MLVSSSLLAWYKPANIYAHKRRFLFIDFHVERKPKTIQKSIWNFLNFCIHRAGEIYMCGFAESIKYQSKPYTFFKRNLQKITYKKMYNILYFKINSVYKSHKMMAQKGIDLQFELTSLFKVYWQNKRHINAHFLHAR